MPLKSWLRWFKVIENGNIRRIICDFISVCHCKCSRVTSGLKYDVDTWGRISHQRCHSDIQRTCVCITDFLITGRPARSATMPVLFYSVVQKWVFRPAGATRCPDKREIWHGGQKVRSHVPNFTFIGAEMWEYSPQIRIFAINLPLGGNSFAQFLRNSQILYASPGGF